MRSGTLCTGPVADRRLNTVAAGVGLGQQGIGGRSPLNSRLDVKGRLGTIREPA